MLNTYSILNDEITGNLSLTLNEGKSIHWRSLALFLNKLKKREWELLQNMSTIDYQYSSIVLKSSIVQGEVDMKRFRDRWYDYALSPPIGSKPLIEKLDLPDDLLYPRVEDIQEMALQFLSGMAWTSLYYHKGTVGVNREWFYPYFYAPTLQDLATICAYVALNKAKIKTVKPFPRMLKYNVVHQMLCILPPASIDLLPEEVRGFLLPQSPIIDQFPLSFNLDKDGKHKSFQFHALVPHANLHRIFTVVEFVNFSKKKAKRLQPQKAYIGKRRNIDEIRLNVRPKPGGWTQMRGRGRDVGWSRGRTRGRRGPPRPGATRVRVGQLPTFAVEQTMRAETTTNYRKNKVRPNIPTELMQLVSRPKEKLGYDKERQRKAKFIHFDPKGRVLSVTPKEVSIDEKSMYEIITENLSHIDLEQLPVVI
jgi:hypothetical protein